MAKPRQRGGGVLVLWLVQEKLRACHMNAEKTPLILIPGVLCTDALWQAQLDGLEDAARVAVTAEHTRHTDIGAIAGAILAAAPPRFALAGLSFGGYIAFEIMRRAPHRVDRLALLDTTARPDPEERRKLRRDLIKQAQIGRFLGVTDKLLPDFIHPDRLADTVLTDAVKEMALKVGRDGFVRQQTAVIGRPDSRPDLPEIDCPTLVLVGRQDVLTPLAVHEEMQAAIPGSQLCVIEDSGHLPTMERPEAVNQAMRDWLGW
jgi:pimeloyl-ACP methyl ester carboxylesterase